MFGLSCFLGALYLLAMIFILFEKGNHCHAFFLAKQCGKRHVLPSQYE